MSVNEQEFQKIVNDIIGVDKTGRGESRITTNKEFFEERWLTGGRIGGSCWDTGDPVFDSVDSEKEPEFSELNVVLEELCPSITYLHYQKLVKFVTFDSESQDEYYGNYSVYSIKRLKVEDLWDFLVEHNYCK